MDEAHKPIDSEGLFNLSYLGLKRSAYDLALKTRHMKGRLFYLETFRII
jgi:hypothetical protein